MLRRFLMPAFAASLLWGGAAAQTYQANLGPMPLDEATKGNMPGRGGATANWDGPVRQPRTMLQEVHRSETGQAVSVFTLPKQR